MMNTARTACVLLAAGWSMPNASRHSMVRSLMTGNVTSTFFMPLYSIFSLIVRSQAMWLYVLSIDSPSSLQFSFSNSGCIEAKVMNSVVQTGVKSAGCEKKTTHLPLEVVGKRDRSLRRLRLEGRRLLADQR